MVNIPRQFEEESEKGGVRVLRLLSVCLGLYVVPIRGLSFWISSGDFSMVAEIVCECTGVMRGMSSVRFQRCHNVHGLGG